MELENVVTCPVCGNQQFTPHLTTRDFTVTNGAFRIVKCASCGLGITNPRPSSNSIGRYYESPQYISHTGGTNNIIDRIYRAIRRYSIGNKLDLISRFTPRGKILDFGCGTGEFLAAAKHKGWAATGIEPSPEARRKIPAGIPVHESLKGISEVFDVITLWHVLEHVHELNQTIDDLRQRLRPGGIIFIAVPNYESFDATHYTAHWAGYDVPRHLWHFTKEAIKRLLNSHKLELLETYPMKFDSFYVSLLSESYKAPGSNLVKAAKAFATGLRSNLKANSDNYSSLIYIARS